MGLTRRTRLRPRRETPRRRLAPRWSWEDWQEWSIVLLGRQDGNCARCARPIRTAVERHHRQRRAVGGDRASNVLLLHPSCHKWVTEHPEEARRLGLIVAAFDDPTVVPLYRGGGWEPGWFLLDDEGGLRATAPPVEPDDDPGCACAAHG